MTARQSQSAALCLVPLKGRTARLCVRQKSSRLHKSQPDAHSLSFFDCWQEGFVCCLFCFFFHFHKRKLALISVFISWPACLEVGNAVMTWQDSCYVGTALHSFALPFSLKDKPH